MVYTVQKYEKLIMKIITYLKGYKIKSKSNQIIFNSGNMAHNAHAHTHKHRRQIYT